jgi:pyruvate kinase
VRSAHKVGATLVLCLAESGTTAQLIAKYRPACRIMCMCIPMREEKKKIKVEGCTSVCGTTK